MRESTVPAAEASGCGCSHDHGHVHAHAHQETSHTRLYRLLCGAVLFGAALLLERFAAGTPALSLLVFAAAYLTLGGDVLWGALKNITRGRVFDENFLMGLATVGALAIGQVTEAVAVMLFYQVGESFQDMAVRRSRRSIAALMDIRPDSATVRRGGALLKVAPDTVDIGEVIVVRPGEKIPLDGVVIEGASALDTSALTGESLPRDVSAGDAVLSGCVNKNGLLAVRVTKLFGDSTASKILDLVENASAKKAPVEHFITTFSRYYTPAVVALAALLAVVPPLFLGGEWAEWLSRGLIFLVISCPCALVISIPLGFFGGIGRASRAGILVKGGNYLDALNKLDTVVFDKTGTLTKGVFSVSKIVPAQGFTADELLALAARAEAFSTHPIAQSVVAAYGKKPATDGLTGYEELAGLGVRVMIDNRTVWAGNEKLMARAGISYTLSAAPGTKVYIALDGVFAGCLVISDQIKPDSQSAVASLKVRGVRKTVMLTGDSPDIAEAVAGELGLDEVYGGLLPAQKVDLVERLDAKKRPGGKLLFVGDGINDAPVLARADIGVAMGGVGSDAAIEAADIVLMTDEPSKLAEAVEIAAQTKRVVWQNIVFALGVKGIFLLLGAFGVATLWEAVFADVGVALLAVLNATRLIHARAR